MSPRDELRQIKLAQVRQKREAATRARRLAVEFSSAEDRDRALHFAEELDVQADELERGMAQEGTTSPIGAQPPVTQSQVQVQQGPPASSEDEKKGEDEKKK